MSEGEELSEVEELTRGRERKERRRTEKRGESREKRKKASVGMQTKTFFAPIHKNRCCQDFTESTPVVPVVDCPAHQTYNSGARTRKPEPDNIPHYPAVAHI